MRKKELSWSVGREECRGLMCLCRLEASRVTARRFVDVVETLTGSGLDVGCSSGSDSEQDRLIWFVCAEE